MSPKLRNAILATVGAILGGGLGSVIYVWLARQGILMIAVPGALLGVGAGWLSTTDSRLRGLLCALAAIALGYYLEWYLFFNENNTLGYFISHLHDLIPRRHIFIALGGLVAYWFASTSSKRDRPKEPQG